MAVCVDRSIGTVILFVLVGMMPIARAADMEALREKCIAYGAAPGSAVFFSCMKELDSSESNKEEFNRRVKAECNYLDMQVRSIIGDPCMSGIGRCDSGKADRLRQQCIRNVERQVFGTKTNARRCTREGTEIVCEDE